MRLISEDKKINISFDNWDIEISSPYINPPIYYIKATSSSRSICLASCKNMLEALYVLNEIQKHHSSGLKECRLSDIIKKNP